MKRNLILSILIILFLSACKPAPTPVPTLPPPVSDRWVLSGSASDFCSTAKDLVDEGEKYVLLLDESEALHMKMNEDKVLIVEEHAHFFPQTRGADMTGRKLPHNEGWIFSLKTPEDKILETLLVGSCDGSIVTLSLLIPTPTP